MTRHTKLFGVAARKMRPTRAHRPAIWECLLGTVYASDGRGNVKYFDYDRAAAIRFSGVDKAEDPRVWRAAHTTGKPDSAIQKGQLVLYVER